MRIAILTTDTTHHRYFVWRLAQVFPIAAIFLETLRSTPKFPVLHPFETLRDAYESEVLLSSAPATFGAIADSRETTTMNDPGAISALEKLGIDVAIVFGTGKLKADILNLGIKHFLNLHGGNPEFYRGLDSHLWAIYHRDFGGLVTTLHHVAPQFDTGDIIMAKGFDVPRGTELHQLRGINTDACVDLCAAALSVVDKLGHLPSRPQAANGRYYSAMPAVLKEECVTNFNRFASRA